jgi:hypothetical protein
MTYRRRPVLLSALGTLFATSSKSCLDASQLANRTNALEDIRLPDPPGRAGKLSTRMAATCEIVAPDAACESAPAGRIVHGTCGGVQRHSEFAKTRRPYGGARACRCEPCRSRVEDPRPEQAPSIGKGTDTCVDAERDVDGVLERGRRRVKRACTHIRREGVLRRGQVSEVLDQSCVKGWGSYCMRPRMRDHGRPDLDACSPSSSLLTRSCICQQRLSGLCT